MVGVVANTKANKNTNRNTRAEAAAAEAEEIANGHPLSGEGSNNKMTLWTWPWKPSGARPVTRKRLARTKMNNKSVFSIEGCCRPLLAIAVALIVLDQILLDGSYYRSSGNEYHLRIEKIEAIEPTRSAPSEPDPNTYQKRPGDLSLAVLVAGSTHRFLFDSFAERVAGGRRETASGRKKVRIDYFAVLTLQSGPAFRQDLGYMGHLAGRDALFDDVPGFAGETKSNTERDSQSKFYEYFVESTRHKMLEAMNGALDRAVDKRKDKSNNEDNNTLLQADTPTTRIRALRLLENPIEYDPVLDPVKSSLKQKLGSGDPDFDFFKFFPMKDYRPSALKRNRNGNKNIIRLFLALESLWKNEFLSYEKSLQEAQEPPPDRADHAGGEAAPPVYDYVLIVRDDALWLDDFDLEAVIATDPDADAYVLSCDARQPQMLPPEINDHGILIKRSKASVVGEYVSSMVSLDLKDCHDSVEEYVGKQRGCNSEMVLRHVLEKNNVRVKLVPQSVLPFERAVRIEDEGGSKYYCYHKFCQSIERPLELPGEIKNCKELDF